MTTRKTQAVPALRIRPATEEDVNFIFNSWLKSYRDSFFGKNISKTIYFASHHKILEKLLKNCSVLVAVDANNPGDIVGYCVTEDVAGFQVIHFVYVKHIFRMLGIAKALLNAAKIDMTKASIYTHHTKSCYKVVVRYNMVYNPYLAFTDLYREPKEEEMKGSFQRESESK